MTQPGELKALLRQRLGAPFRVLYQPKFRPAEHFQHVLTLLIEAKDCTLLVDEAANYCGSNSLGDEFDYVIRCGRHLGISLVWNSQRPVMVHPSLRSVSRLALFRMEDTRDLVWLRDVGFPRERLPELAALPNRTFFLKFGASWVQVRPDSPDRRTVPASRAT